MILRSLHDFLRYRRYRNLTLITLGVLLTGIFGYRIFEGWSWLDSVDYAVATMVTTGNTQFYPQTTGGKIFNICYMILSVILILMFVNTLNQHFHDIRLTREYKNKRHHRIVERKIDRQNKK